MNVTDGSWKTWNPPEGPTSITIGVFDGVHRGHRALIEHLDDRHETTVLTFEPHPVEVLRPGTPPRLITTIEERLELLEGAGVRRVGVLDLAEIKDLSAEEFVSQVLVDKLAMAHLVLGPDFRFGRDRLGDLTLLEELSRVHGYRVDPVALVSDEQGPVSSSRIRVMIEEGRPAAAARELTTRFKITGPVIHGDKRGADIGFPTANIRPPERKVVPAIGVYAAFAHHHGSPHPAAVSVGVRPTFGGGELLVEAYIMDFHGEIYGDQLTVEFVEYLRPELDFERVDDLVARMAVDVTESRQVLESTTSNVG